MTLFSYLDNRFRTLSIELQKDYTIAKEAELKAAYSLIQVQRSFFKYLTMPVLFVKYLLINARLLEAPISLQPKEVPPVINAEHQGPEFDTIN